MGRKINSFKVINDFLLRKTKFLASRAHTVSSGLLFQFLLFLITGVFYVSFIHFYACFGHFRIKELRTLSKIPGCVLTFLQVETKDRL